MLVGFSHEKAGAAVAEYLAYRAVRHPALLSADDYRASLRRKGFVDAAARRGFQDIPTQLVPTPTTLGSGRKALAGLLEAHPEIDAVFCSSDVLAHGVLTEAHARGLDIPGRLRVFGFGDLDFAANTYPALSTVRIDGTAHRAAGRAFHHRPRRRAANPGARDRHRLQADRPRQRLTAV
jgi:LacI family gluconate utilization system Gnt-I transcriptional repressor